MISWLPGWLVRLILCLTICSLPVMLSGEGLVFVRQDGCLVLLSESGQQSVLLNRYMMVSRFLSRQHKVITED